MYRWEVQSLLSSHPVDKTFALFAKHFSFLNELNEFLPALLRMERTILLQLDEV